MTPTRIRATCYVAVLTLALGTAWLWTAGSRQSAALMVTFLDVGQGDSIVVRTPRGSVMVVDCGGRTPEDDQGRRVVLPFLRSQGINRVDALVLTHPDEDHIGGALSLLSRIPVSCLLVSQPASASPACAAVLREARRLNVPVSTLARGMCVESPDGVVTEVLNPAPRGIASDNDASLVMRIRYGSRTVLLTGDAEAAAEGDMRRASATLGADVLKLGHHGSATSSSEQFLNAVHPAAAIISAGRRNPFGHPHPLVLERLARRSVRVFRTDKDGAVTVVCDGKSLWIDTALRSQAQ
jgi:competence protein ComEC